MAMVPLILIPMLLPRKALAKKLSPSEAADGLDTYKYLTIRQAQIQTIVDDFKIRMAIPNTVFVSIVERNPLVVSVERAKDGSGDFVLSVESNFLVGLTRDEIDAVIAHELGHVWIFTHHPFLQTEQLANEIAMRVVHEDTLAAVYDKVWKRVGRKGELVYLPSMTPAAARQAQ